jgi:hypothetical protein
VHTWGVVWTHDERLQNVHAGVIHSDCDGGCPVAGEGGLERSLLHHDVPRAFALVLGSERLPKLFPEVAAQHKVGLAEAERAENGDVLSLRGELALGGGAAATARCSGGGCGSGCAPAVAAALHPAAVPHVLKRGVNLRG